MENLREALTTPPQDDGMIVAAILGGEESRFAELVTRYRIPLLRLAYSRLGCSDAADDAVQETFLCAFKSLPSYDSRFSFRTWLWTILLNQCRRSYRKRKQQQDLIDSSESASDVVAANFVSTESNPVAKLVAKEQNELLHAMLHQLPERQADALRLRFFGGLKFREIAEAMGCSLSSAKNRVRWGLVKMSDLLREQTATSSTAGGQDIRKFGEGR